MEKDIYTEYLKELPPVTEGAEPKFKEGDKVWLGEFEENPRQQAEVLTADSFSWGVSYVVQVKPEDVQDDGLREVTEDQIEGLCDEA